MAEIARRGGCVLTITNRYTNSDPTKPNPFYGQSTRIVAISLGATTFQVMAFPNSSASTLPQANDTFIINGAPFSGTGSDTRQVRATSAIPERSGLDMPIGPAPERYDGQPESAGGANPDYTAADFQHVLLAAQVANVAGTALQTLPSLHRPALGRYWAAKAGVTDFQ